jgi:hypothetical protein
MQKGPAVPATLDAASLSSIVQLLLVLAETPSTPRPIADEAHELLVQLQEAIPPQPHHWEPGARGYGAGAVEVEEHLATAAAGLLELLSGMPSTPPSVAEEAGRHGAALWELAESADEGATASSRPEG